MPPEQAPESVFPHKRFLTSKKLGGIILFFIIIIFYNLFFSAPSDFPAGKTININKGSSVSQISRMLKKENIIRSTFTLDAILLASGKQTKVNAGSYFFPEPAGVFSVARSLSDGKSGLASAKITVTEGMASFDIPELFGKEFHNFDRNEFLKLAEPKEGYLFPDTYFFYTDVSAEEVVRVMNGTFNQKIKGLEDGIKNSGKSLHDIVIMASIVELEARKPEDRELVSGILWKRLSINMALQVDAPFAYISDKSTYDLTADDLKQNSPYNTYNRTGLPPGAIGNPGTDAIMATIYAKPSPYLYYLSDRAGNIYYAKNFEEHKRNKAKYLN
ncbi:MAG: endolytic transglycosylase MltG [Candidatus Paceibacterota bacterium]